MGRPKKYFTEEERKAAKNARNKKYYQDNKKKILERQVKHRKEYRDKWNEYLKKFHSTKEGRASYLISRHKQEDKKRNRGNCDLTMPWFVRNIFTKCIYCGETDWKKLGCDRINNDLPHTIENVVPACWDCNRKRKKKPFDQFYWESKHEKTLGE